MCDRRGGREENLLIQALQMSGKQRHGPSSYLDEELPLHVLTAVAGIGPQLHHAGNHKRIGRGVLARRGARQLKWRAWFFVTPAALALKGVGIFVIRA